MSESLKPSIAVTVVGALAVGVAVFLARGPTFQSLDGGVVAELLRDGGPTAPVFPLPDGGQWPNDPDAGIVPVDSSTCGQVTGLQTCTVMLPTGAYARYQVFVPADGGRWLFNSSVGFDCICATDAGACTFVDGGPVPLTGSYAPAVYGLMSGPGCVGRVCQERAGWSGATAGCQP